MTTLVITGDVPRPTMPVPDMHTACRLILLEGFDIVPMTKAATAARLKKRP